MNWYINLVRPLLFHLNPELAHDLTLSLLTVGERMHLIPAQIPPNAAPRRVMGLEFPNPIGLAAGLDKNAVCIDGLAALGFGFIEVGTITPKGQSGNPKPRLFRLPKAEALINRMGFNNDGLSLILERIKKRRSKVLLGINIGKNKDTPLENAIEDYLLGFIQAYPLADYITVNLSSPNTPGLRDLQHGNHRDHLFQILKEKQTELNEMTKRYVPLVVKISPDLTDDELFELAEALLNYHIDGVIATNTTISRVSVSDLPYARETGGLSGAPLSTLSTEIVSKLYSQLGEKIPIIAAGGIISAETAIEKFEAGAKLLQLYTGFIYRGPGLITEIVKYIK